MSAATDRAGTAINPGDTVHVVYGGDRHHLTVTSVDHPGEGVPTVTGTAAITVPAASTHLLRKAKPKPSAPKSATS